MTNTERLVFIDLAIKTLQQFIKETPEEDHYGDYEYLDSLRELQLDVLKGVCPQSEFTQGECDQIEDTLVEITSKQTMNELYEVLTEAHDQAMHETLISIYNENYIIPKEITQDEILDFIEDVYNSDGINTVH